MQFLAQQVSHFIEFLLRPLVKLITTKTYPENLAQMLTDEKVHHVYVLPKKSKVDRLVVRRICRKKRLPVPSRFLDPRKKCSAALIYINNSGFLRSRKSLKPHEGLIRNLNLQATHDDLNIKFVPVSPFWGKNPGREEKSLWKLIFNDDENAGWLQRFFIVLIQARNNLVYFAEPISAKEILSGEKDCELVARRLKRKLRLHFRDQRNTVLGKELYIREQVISSVASGQMVRAEIDREIASSKKKSSSRSLETKARRYARELAADQRYNMVRTFEQVLARLWNKLFDGVEIQNLHNVRDLAKKDYEIVYVPTHRSHLDYLLTSYTIYESGMPSPHIAAGINLNFWPIGWFLRRAGAFFIRRSFKGNRIYTAVVNDYIHYLLTQGYPVTFFPEGGRSRTGKLLPFKTGMMAMVVHSFLRRHQRPIAFVPVYLGYDKVMEVKSYLSELGGKKKRKESLGNLLKARRSLKSYYGKVHVSYGKPLLLEEFLDERQDDWREFKGTIEKPEWLPRIVQDLASEISVRLNMSAVVNPISLVGLVLLSAPQKALPREDLINFIDTFLLLHKTLAEQSMVKVIGESGDQILAMAERLGMFENFQHSGGDVLYLKDEQSVFLSYYRNNIIHLFALPSLIAGFFRIERQVQLAEIIDGCAEIYPFLQEEFNLPWAENELAEAIERYTEALTSVGLIIKDGAVLKRPEPSFDQFENLSILANSLGLTFERYTVTVALLAQHSKKGYVDEQAFELQSRKMAQRLAILNGINNPEFSDKSFVNKHIQLLKKRGLLIPTEDDRLKIDPQVKLLAGRSMKLLSFDARFSLEKIFASQANNG